MAQTPMGVGAPRWRGAKLGYSTQTGNGSDAAELGTGKGLIHVARNLSTSRLVSYGFLAQATELLVDTSWCRPARCARWSGWWTPRPYCRTRR